MKIAQPKKAGGVSSLKSTIQQLVKSRKVRDNIKNLSKVNQSTGFDCPGCAWGDQKDGTFQFCENGVKAVAWESTDKQVTAEFFKEYSVSQLNKQSDYWLEYQGRLAQPMRYNRTTDHYEPISWEDANQLIAQKIKGLDSPNQVEFYTSGRASNESSFLYQLFGRMLGTNNFPDCSNMCHEASGIGLTESVGVGKGTVTLDDFDEASTIFVFGQNPQTNHPRMLNALRKASRRGAKIISFNNLKEVGLQRFASPQDPVELLTPAATTISQHYFTPKLGGDMAAVRGMVKHLLEKDTQLDTPFIEQHCVGFDSYQQQVLATSWEHIAEQSGLSKEEIVLAADMFAESESIISTWAMGITQHKHSVDTVREIVNLHLMFGQVGKKGAGLCPVRGHSNVQGNRTMGINEKPNEAFLAPLETEFGFEAPREHGHNLHQAIKALHSKQSKVLVCLGGNVAAAAPDTQYTYQAMKNAELTVQISTKLNRSHLMTGTDALILPCLGRTEKDVQASGEQAITVEDTFSMVHASKSDMEPLSSECKSETAIVANMASATLGNELVDWKALVDDYALIRDRIQNVLPQFYDFNARLKEPGGFHLTNAAAEHQWNTTSHKAQFNDASLPKSILDDSLAETIKEKKCHTLVLQTMRSHDQFNTTIYGMDDRYRGVVNERMALFISQKDLDKLGLEEGARVKLISIWPDNTERAVDGFKLVAYDIPAGNIAAYYPETNPLIPIDSYGDKSFTPNSKSVAVYIEKSQHIT